MKIRPFWVFVRRYTVLGMTVFLVVVGLTGSLLAFYKELDGVINPHLYVEAHGRTLLNFDALIKNADDLIAPQASVQSLWASSAAVHFSVSPRQNEQTSQTFELNYDQLILDPYTGGELGRRWGAISEG
ncbi:PepSY domain-containing protein [Methylomonas sp. TEB]|uniref:PepSY domain-containing protein n=1 Tax=Methylomonas sp. TEB TaxID=3398229 RepID=UPI0039F61458